ncbi:MAG TPA: lipid-binding SYLF domain-containing protein [Casimicrobiaceae bacterium]|jgi:lipid-binding SYLF domain-containing protein
MVKRFVEVASRVLLAFLLALTSGVALAQSEQQKIVDEADTTLSNFLRDPQMTWLHENIGKAKAVLIAPEVVKAGFIFGGSGGRAVLIAHDPKSGRWVGPAFYTLATASVGFQAGVQVSEVLTLVMTDRGMRSLLATSVKLGPDVGIAAGPIGAGATADVVSDLVSFSRSKGVYGGLNLDGTAVTVSDEWNRAYYGKAVQPSDILVTASAHNKGASKLLGDAAREIRK